MKWLIELIISWFKGQSGRQAETRADFAAVSEQWEALSIRLTERMEKDELRFDAVEKRLTQESIDNLRREQECLANLAIAKSTSEAKLATVEARVAELEAKLLTEGEP